MGFVATIIVGVLAGWLAEKVMKVDMPTWQNLLLGRKAIRTANKLHKAKD